jgi:3'-5' exoribonuclease
VPLGELTSGQQADFFALLAEKTRGLTREGKVYWTCRFRDRRRSATFMVWSDSPWLEACEREWRAGHFYKLRAVFVEHEKFGPQLAEVQAIRPVNDADLADGFDPSQIIETSRHDPAQMLTELKELAGTHIADLPLRRLVLTVLERQAAPLQRLPATRDRFYPFIGGLLEHTLNVTRTAVQLGERYTALYPQLQPPLNRDLIAAAAILHDIGRTLSLEPDGYAAEPTIPGRLAGHLVLGRDLVRDAAGAQGDVNPELLQLLEHILLAHLALPEWGSPRLPLIPECLIVHHADDLDAKLEMFARCLLHDPSAGPFTERDPFLGRQLLKGRTV